MMRERYTVRRGFALRGRVLVAGESVALHPREAKYLIGTHLVPAAPAAGKRRGAAKTNGGNS